MNDTISPSPNHPVSPSQLSPQHLSMLHASAISDSVILARGYRTVTSLADLRALGFAPAQCRVPGLLLPLWTTDGSPGLAVYRPDNPRVLELKSNPREPGGAYPNKVIKYEMPKGAGVRLDCPPGCQASLGDPHIPLWITEGQKKADSLASVGLTAIALLGVWNFKGKNEHGGVTLLADWDFIALQDRAVRIVFDSDVMRKRLVQDALLRLIEHLGRKGASVSTVYLPPGPDSAKLGVDDWLALGHTVQELEGLLEAPRLSPMPAPDRVVLLDSAPLTITRPLSLLAGRSYAAAWIYVQTTKTEAFNKAGEVVRIDPPIQTTGQHLFIIRDDGLIFGPGGDRPLDALDLQVHLPEIPPDGKTWRKPGVMSYHRGERPDPKDVFERLTAIVDYFIDFDRSLADQSVLAELVACYILSTWFLDAFNCIGYLWPNGEKGCGKTKLLLVVSELAYLGQLILASGTFATLRDLAEYGATLAFDDYETISDLKIAEVDRRALILAGNRRGVTVSVKELGPDKKWFTRYVNAYCPRLFSAIHMPDPTLSSRVIIIPLIPTADHRRANAEPFEYSTWPHDHHELLDDLWALALAHLPEFPLIDRWVGENAPLGGRNLQPWRAVLAVAKWLDDQGVPGLWERMVQLSLDYQKERPDLEISDLTLLVIRALLKCTQLDLESIKAINSINSINNINNESASFTLSTADITETVVQIAKDDEVDIEIDTITSRRIGRILGKMRFGRDRQGGRGPRRWLVREHELRRQAISYGLVTPQIEITNTSAINGVNGDNGVNGANDDYLQGII